MLACIARQGCAIYIEVPCFDWIRRNGAFFDVTYEHVNYFNLKSLAALFDGAVLEQGRMFGDQYIYVIAALENASPAFGERYANGPWVEESFDQLFPELAEKIDLIDAQLGSDRRLYLWGAATKGCLFLLHCQRHRKVVHATACAIDINPGKIGKYLPGSRIPIRGPQALFEQAGLDDLLCVANPNYVDEIKASLEAHGLGAMNVTSL
jgi:hypothetical protein